MILNTLFPVFAVIFLGRVLRLSGFVSRDFFHASDRLVYFIFFPCMLFWKIGTGDPSAGFDPYLFAAVLAAVLLVFVLSTAYIVFGKVGAFQAGSFSQSCYRFNTYIGMAVMLKAAGDSGVVLFAVLIGLIIPVINVLSVGVLIWFSEKHFWRFPNRLSGRHDLFLPAGFNCDLRAVRANEFGYAAGIGIGCGPPCFLFFPCQGP